MDFELSDEQQFLREAAGGARPRHATVEAARDALDGGERLDLWDVGREAGWPGLVVSEARGGAGLGALDAMLVMAEAGRGLAGVGLLGHVPATAVLDATQDEHEDLLRALAEGEKRAAFAGAQPPEDGDAAWTVDPVEGHGRGPAPRATFDDGRITVTGTVPWTPDAPEADVLVVVATGEEDGAPVAVRSDRAPRGGSLQPGDRHAAARALRRLPRRDPAPPPPG